MEDRGLEIVSSRNKRIVTNVIPGHFATGHSHINYYVDLIRVKCNSTTAKNVAGELASDYAASTLIDTIVCLDDTEIIGAYTAEILTESGHYISSDNSINVITPEFDHGGQMILRDNIQRMIWNKGILLLVASATTGRTITKSMDCVRYYGGTIRGISALFSAADSIDGIKINSVFTKDDIPNYKTYSYHECPDCLENRKIDAIVNSHGYSKI